jgi:hypothetical protein
MSDPRFDPPAKKSSESIEGLNDEIVRMQEYVAELENKKLKMEKESLVKSIREGEARLKDQIAERERRAEAGTEAPSSKFAGPQSFPDPGNGLLWHTDGAGREWYTNAAGERVWGSVPGSPEEVRPATEKAEQKAARLAAAPPPVAKSAAEVQEWCRKQAAATALGTTAAEVTITSTYPASSHSYIATHNLPTITMTQNTAGTGYIFSAPLLLPVDTTPPGDDMRAHYASVRRTPWKKALAHTRPAEDADAEHSDADDLRAAVKAWLAMRPGDPRPDRWSASRLEIRPEYMCWRGLTAIPRPVIEGLQKELKELGYETSVEAGSAACFTVIDPALLRLA